MFFHMPVTLSTPINVALPIKILSASTGACITLTVQYIQINKHIIHPITPHTLLELIEPF
nr:MAG TPA: hypothetical protein [Bacteriophage sp.]DAT46408.1 MAG TPA: hypothetical protein [Caudoviricetes sp.]